jgi:hypothetical protein
MGIPDLQKLDSLWKRVFYGLTSTNTVPAKESYSETIPSYTPVLNQWLWLDSASIPSPAPTSTNDVVQVYNSSVALQMTTDPTVPGSITWLATSSYGDLTTVVDNWINPGIDSSYLVKIYNGNPATGGRPLIQTAKDLEWIFDYSAGVLRFVNNVPAGLTGLWLVGFRYRGRLGVPATLGATVIDNTGQINNSSLLLGQIIFSRDDGTGQWGLYMVTNLNPTVLTPITTQSGTPLATPDATLARLITPPTPSVVTFGTLPAGTVINEVDVNVTSAFDSTPTLSIGDDQDHQRLMSVADIDLNFVGNYTNLSNFNYAVNTQVRAYFDTALSTRGSAEVTLTYINKTIGTTGKITTFIQNIDSTMTSPFVLGPVKAGQIVLTTEIDVVTPFDGDAAVMSMSVGDSQDPDLLLSHMGTDIGHAFNYLNEANYRFPADDVLQVYFNLGGSTTGLATISITLS